MLSTREIMENARLAGIVVPAFNIPHLPMMSPIVSALRDTSAFGLIQVARLEWIKFEAKSLHAIRDEYERVGDADFTRLHLDHVPVIDEDNRKVDYLAVLREALDLGYQSVMVDGSRLSLDENIACTAAAAKLAHEAGVPIEGELGAVLGHEAGPLPPYEELFVSGKGFTDPDEAARFVRESGVDWLSVAIGNVHGAISGAARSKEKIRARLNQQHLSRIRTATGDIPLVLHGGSGIHNDDLTAAFKNGITKINIGTTLRQAYEKARNQSVEYGQQTVYDVCLRLIREELGIENLVTELIR